MVLTKLDKTSSLPACASLARSVVALAVLEQDAVAVVLLEGVIIAILELPAEEDAFGKRGDLFGIHEVTSARPLSIADSRIATVKALCCFGSPLKFTDEHG